MSQHRVPIWLTCSPSIFATIIALCILWEGNDMSIGDWVAIGVAVIGLIGVMWGSYTQLKRDSKTIEEIKVAEATAKEVHDKEIIPGLKLIEKQTDKIDSLVSDVEYRKRLETNLPHSAAGKDMINTGVAALIADNQQLLAHNQELILKYAEAQRHIATLETQNDRLQQKLQKYQAKNEPEKDYEMEM